MADKKISELTTNSSPSPSATLVGVVERKVDGETIKETVQIPVSALGSSGGGIIDVAELPTENIDKSAIYRVRELSDIKKLQVLSETLIISPYEHTEIVDELPEVGTPYVDFTTGECYTYYLRTDGKIYGYVTDEIVENMDSAVIGWNDLHSWFEGVGVELVLIHSLDEADYGKAEANEVMYYLVIEKEKLYTYFANGGAFEQLVTKSELNSNTSSGGASIIYATEKPSTPQQAIYVITEDEVVKAELIEDSAILPSPNYVEIVDELPEIGELMVDVSTGAWAFYMYYLTIDGGVYAYADAELSAALGYQEGWNDLVQAGMLTVINAIEEGTEGVYCLLTKQPKTRVYVPLPDGTFLELTSGIRTRFDEKSGTVSITEM